MEERKNFKVGDGVKVVSSYEWLNGVTGTIICMPKDPIFDASIGVQLNVTPDPDEVLYHTCGGLAKEPTCLWFLADELEFDERVKTAKEIYKFVDDFLEWDEENLMVSLKHFIIEKYGFDPTEVRNGIGK
jgi:hypothetical protein